nr:hypothetical protein LKV13_04990 [Borrelia sp. BU AG58]
MKKIALTALFALALVACKHDYSGTKEATTAELKEYLAKNHSVEGKVYSVDGINGVLNKLDNKDAFLKAVTLKIAATDDEGKKKFEEGVKELKLPATGAGSFDTIIESLKETAAEKPKAKAEVAS